MVDRVGQQLGNYQLIRMLGEGGFAEVYLGEHIHLGTKAAIKVLHTQLTSDDVDKFRDEARTIANLIHPNIVRVLEFGIEGKTPFLVMDYAPNGTLRQKHPKGVLLPLPTIVNYVKQVAEALQSAHEEKFIHRDVKPENMLLGRRSEVLLSDFGIALVAQSSRYQNTQDMAGTIAYMAPEQIGGKPRPASDQYALGVVVYEWLSGDRPFHGNFTEIAVQHTVTPPPSLREKVPTILPDVEQVVMVALAKEPKERFGSVQAFARALEQASQSDVVTFVKPAVPVVQTLRVVTPPSSPAVQTPQMATTPGLPPTLPASLPLPPTQTVSNIKPVGTVVCTYRGHSGRVNAVAWSSDGKRIASASDDRTVQVWDATAGSDIRTYRGHSNIVRSMAWSPSGLHIASGSDDKTVQVWDAATGSHGGIYRGHSKQVNAVAWSPDGKYIASGSDDKTVQVWDVATGSHVFTYRGHSNLVNAVAWLSDSRRIASGSNDWTVQVWDATTGHHIIIYRGHSNVVNTVTWSPNVMRIATAGYDTAVQVWNATTGDSVYTYRGHSDHVRAVRWSPDGKRIASGDASGRVQVWDATTGNKVFTYKHATPVYTVAWSPDGKYIASGGDDRTVRVWVAP